MGFEGDDLTGGDGDLADEAGLDLLGEGGDRGDLGGEVLAELLHLAGSLLAGGAEVLDGLGEARVSEGSLLGEGVVEASDGGAELGGSVATVLGELDVGSTELSGGGLLS